jgi:hypothetical protein
MDITSRGDNFRFSDKHLDERDQQRTDTFRHSGDRHESQRQDFRFNDKNGNDRLQHQVGQIY